MINDTKNFLLQVKSLSTSPALVPIYNYCTRAVLELYRPLRLAITGMIKTGKSTLLNAFLGRNIVPTAVEVMTYNVNWFHHVKNSPDGTECFVVHYLDGRQEKHQLIDISTYVGYNENKRDVIDSIHWVDAYVDNPLLNVFDIIDTPGLNSILGTDSQHTKDLLTKEINRPDAIIYLISGEVQSEDVEEVSKFNQSTGLLSGINTIAALTRVDELTDHYDGAIDIIEFNKERYAEIRYNFAEIYAIAALPGLASKSLSDDEISLLKKLSFAPDVDTLLSTKNQFENSDWADKDTRCRLIEKLSIEGIKLVKTYFLEYPSATTNECRRFLSDFSHVNQLEQTIVNRFGDRADFYKSNIAISGLRKLCVQLIHKRQFAGNDLQQVKHIQMLIKNFDMQLHQEYTDYYLLNDYYNQETYFDDDDWERVKRILGEYGKEDYICLNLERTASKEEIITTILTEISYWNDKVRRAIVMNNYTRQLHAKQIIQILNKKLNLYQL